MDFRGLEIVMLVYLLAFGAICAAVAIGLEHLIPYLWHHVHWS